MPHASQAAFLTQAALLRDARFDAELERSGAVHGALFCDLDPEIGQSRLRLRGTPGMIAAIDAEVAGTPRWVVLRLELGEAAFLPGDVLGLVVNGSADRALTLRPYLRMVRDGRLADTRFGEAVALSPEPRVITALHTLSAMDPACGAPGHCALVLGLPAESARVRLEDMRLFVIPAAEGLRSTPVDLATFAA